MMNIRQALVSGEWWWRNGWRGILLSRSQAESIADLRVLARVRRKHVRGLIGSIQE